MLRDELYNNLTTNILPFWINDMVDHENGGFYGQMDGNGILRKDADKGCILNARILWTFSAAYRVLGDKQYLEMARRAKDYILAHFIDKEYGGCYWSVDYKGNPRDTKKQFYAIGFVLYGMSEYVRATGDRDILKLCIDLYHCIEEHATDPVYGGYIEAQTRSWHEIADMRLSQHDANYPKSQNTHLHIIEPYTNFLRVLRKSEKCSVSNVKLVQEVEASVRALIDIFCDKILNPETNHLDLFFNMDWSRSDVHTESYGHDIECSWLLHEAAFVLGDEAVLRKVEPIVQLVAQASEKGLNPDGSMTHEANALTGEKDTDMQWWVQAEAVVGLYNIHQHFNDNSALHKAEHCWEYIKNNLVDTEHGEWYWCRTPDGQIDHTQDKAGFWKFPYHNGRMCLEIIERTT